MRKTKKEKLYVSHIEKYRDAGLAFSIIILIIIIQIRNTRFLTLENINDLLTNTAILSILAVGMMMVIITRGIDLSVGATLALVGMSTALTVEKYPDMHPLLSIAMGIGLGVVCGFIVGLLVAKSKVLPIIATLGMMNIYRGITFFISGGRWVSAHQMPESFKDIARTSVLGVNNLIVIALIVILVSYYFLNYTRIGRYIYATGSNPESVQLSGIAVDRILCIVYTVMGGLAGMAGVLWVSKFASAQGDTAVGYELSVIAVCVLGGVSISGGVGKISTLLAGTLLIGILNNALPLVNVSPFWQNLIQGIVMLCAVIMNVLIKRQLERNILLRRKI